MNGLTGALVADSGGPVPQAASGCEAAHGQCPAEAVHLLQRGGAARRQRPSPELQRTLPIAWVHVPKSGSSFINTMIHLPGVCPGLPDDLFVGPETFGGGFMHNFGHTKDLSKDCPGLLQANRFFGHSGIGSEWSDVSEFFGHMMTMMREPKRRLVSAYHNMEGISKNEHGRFRITTLGQSWGDWPNETLPRLQDFVRHNRGCATRMLTRGGFSCGGAGGMPTEEEVKEAKRRLREGFSFVGITDDWDASMCLFSAMFKVPCHRSMFINNRPGRRTGQPYTPYSVDEHEGVADPYDAELYLEALKIFGENRRRYNVSNSSCARCFREAGLPLIPVSAAKPDAE